MALKKDPEIFAINLFVDIIDGLSDNFLKEGIFGLLDIVLLVEESDYFIVD